MPKVSVQPTPGSSPGQALPSLLKKGGGCILALDFGLKRIGVAVADSDLKMAFPQEPIPFMKMDQAVRETAALIATNAISEAIVGLPVSMAGEETGQTTITREFIRGLQAVCGIPIHAVDERLTTKISQTKMRLQGLSEKERRLLKDSVSAAVMLEEWLQRNAT